MRLNPRKIIRVKFVHCSFHHILTSSGVVSKKIPSFMIVYIINESKHLFST